MWSAYGQFYTRPRNEGPRTVFLNLPYPLGMLQAWWWPCCSTHWSERPIETLASDLRCGVVQDYCPSEPVFGDKKAIRGLNFSKGRRTTASSLEHHLTDYPRLSYVYIWYAWVYCTYRLAKYKQHLNPPVMCHHVKYRATDPATQQAISIISP